MSKDSLDPRGDLQNSRQIGAPDLHTSGQRRLLTGCFVAHRSKTTAGILPLNTSPARTFAHPAKIRGSATTPVTDLVH